VTATQRLISRRRLEPDKLNTGPGFASMLLSGLKGAGGTGLEGAEHYPASLETNELMAMPRKPHCNLFAKLTYVKVDSFPTAIAATVASWRAT